MIKLKIERGVTQPCATHPPCAFWRIGYHPRTLQPPIALRLRPLGINPNQTLHRTVQRSPESPCNSPGVQTPTMILRSLLFFLGWSGCSALLFKPSGGQSLWDQEGLIVNGTWYMWYGMCPSAMLPRAVPCLWLNQELSAHLGDGFAAALPAHSPSRASPRSPPPAFAAPQTTITARMGSEAPASPTTGWQPRQTAFTGPTRASR